MSCEQTSPSQVLLPVLLLSFALMGFLGFQTWMMSIDRDSLNQAYEQQDKTLEQVAKIKLQVNALAKGTLALAQQGDKNAQVIIDDLKKAGVNVQEAPPLSQPQSAAPAASPPQKP